MQHNPQTVLSEFITLRNPTLRVDDHDCVAAHSEFFLHNVPQDRRAVSDRSVLLCNRHIPCEVVWSIAAPLLKLLWLDTAEYFAVEKELCKPDAATRFGFF